MNTSRLENLRASLQQACQNAQNDNLSTDLILEMSRELDEAIVEYYKESPPKC